MKPRPGTCLRLAAFLTVTSAALAADPIAPDDVRGRVRRAVEASEEALKRGETGLALERAEGAERIATKALDRADPDRARAVRVLGRLRCDAAMKADDDRAAVGIAGTVRDAAADANDLPTALDWGAYAEDLARRAYPADDPEIDRVSLALARLRVAEARRANDPVKARDHARRAVGLAGKALPEGDPGRLRDVVSLADLEDAAGQHDEAFRLYGQVAALAREHPEGNTEPRLISLIVAAGALVARGEGHETEAAGRLAEAGRVLSRPDGDSLAAAAHDLVERRVWNPLLARAGGEPTAAAGDAFLADAAERLGAALRAAGAPAGWAAQGPLYLARFQFAGQRLDATGATLDRLSGALEDLGREPAALGDYWTLRGLVETERANFAEARRDHEGAYQAYRDAPYPRRAVALNNFGQLLYRQGDDRLARSALRSAVATHERESASRDHHAMAFAMTNLAKAVEGDGHSREAEALHRRALDLVAAVPRPDAQTDYAHFLCRQNLGVNIYTAGDYDEARGEFLRARGLAVHAFGAGHPHVAEADVNLGWVALSRGDLSGARGRFLAALEVFQARGGRFHPRTAEALGYLARVDALDGRRGDALNRLGEGLDLREGDLRRTLRTSLSEYDRVAYVRDLRVHSESPAWPGLLDTFLELAPGLGIPETEQYRRLLVWKGETARHAPPGGANWRTTRTSRPSPAAGRKP